MVSPLTKGVQAFACRIILTKPRALFTGLKMFMHRQLTFKEALAYKGPAFYPEDTVEDMRVIVDEAGCTVHIMSDSPYTSVLYFYPSHSIKRVVVDEV